MCFYFKGLVGLVFPEGLYSSVLKKKLQLRFNYTNVLTTLLGSGAAFRLGTFESPWLERMLNLLQRLQHCRLKDQGPCTQVSESHLLPFIN